jgi:hypothetical protein
MWNATIDTLSTGRGQQFVVRRGEARLRYDEVLRAWQEDEAFRVFFVGLLADAPFASYRWETPPVMAETVHRPFEFVLLDAPGLERKPDRAAFADQLDAGSDEESVLAFANLGNDAQLIVPRAAGVLSAYGHLAAFMRHAPAEQRHELWRVVGTVMRACIGSNPIWLSTAGMGVPWLHVRLDTRPNTTASDPIRRSRDNRSAGLGWRSHGRRSREESLTCAATSRQSPRRRDCGGGQRHGC